MPDLQPADVYTACISRVANNDYKQKLDASALQICGAGEEYNGLADQESLYTIGGVFPGSGEDPVIINGLTRSELTKLYTQQMVPQNSPSRFSYDQIFVAANDRCPFCGGIGQTYSLDHYLPKAHFPIYSIHPANLVPCCFDCNKVKSNAVVTEQGGQTLHPYFDRDFYFNEKWVSARLIEINAPILDFYVDPPEGWDPVCKARVAAHFNSYKLKKRYKIESGEELSTIVHQRRTIMRNLSPEEFQQQLACISQSPSLNPNHWKRVMYLALSQNTSFLSEIF
ncbi:HNH endonuclease [Porticoccaceae bacterium]|nr:HNH endonuclease [Porticoccaceae bacterium]